MRSCSYHPDASTPVCPRCRLTAVPAPGSQKSLTAKIDKVEKQIASTISAMPLHAITLLSMCRSDVGQSRKPDSTPFIDCYRPATLRSSSPAEAAFDSLPCSRPACSQRFFRCLIASRDTLALPELSHSIYNLHFIGRTRGRWVDDSLPTELTLNERIPLCLQQVAVRVFGCKVLLSLLAQHCGYNLKLQSIFHRVFHLITNESKEETRT